MDRPHPTSSVDLSNLSAAVVNGQGIDHGFRIVEFVSSKTGSRFGGYAAYNR